MSDVFVLSGQRTAIGDYGNKRAEIVIRAALFKSGVEAAEIQHVIMGSVIHPEPCDAYISRVAAANARIPLEPRRLP